jgi:hypothetical protein
LGKGEKPLEELSVFLEDLWSARMLQMCGDARKLREEIERQRIYASHGKLFKLPLPQVPPWRKEEPEFQQLLWQLEQVHQRIRYILREVI